MSTHTARDSYFRALAQFSSVVVGCRRRCRLRVDDVARLSGITARRLRKYEAASAPPHWADALMLARVFGIRVSTIIAAVKKPVADLSNDEYKCFLDYVHGLAAEQARELREDLKRERKIHLEDASSDVIHDASIADWPVFLLPSLGDALVAEASRLHAAFRVLDALSHCNDDLSSLQEVTGVEDIDADKLLVRVQGVMSGIRARLNGLRIRHTDTAPERCIEDIERQRLYILKAMELIAACSSNEALTPDRVARGAMRNEYSIHLPGAVDRALVASFFLIEAAKSLRGATPAVISFDAAKRKSASRAIE